MLVPFTEEQVPKTLEEAQAAKSVLREYLEVQNCPEFKLGVVGKRDQYGIIVYVSKDIDTTFLVPLKIDDIQVRVCKVESNKAINAAELKDITQWYDTYCTVTEEPVMEGPCNLCGEIGYWDVDPFLEDTFNREEWNFWCSKCYTDRSEQI